MHKHIVYYTIKALLLSEILFFLSRMSYFMWRNIVHIYMHSGLYDYDSLPSIHILSFFHIPHERK